MDRIDVDGLRIAYRRTGNGPPLLLLHGACCDSRDWRRQLDACAAEFTVIAWDAPGCGDAADLPSPDYGLDNMIDTLAGFIRALRLQHPPCTPATQASCAHWSWRPPTPAGPDHCRRRRCNAGSGSPCGT